MKAKEIQVANNSSFNIEAKLMWEGGETKTVRLWSASVYSFPLKELSIPEDTEITIEVTVNNSVLHAHADYSASGKIVKASLQPDLWIRLTEGYALQTFQAGLGYPPIVPAHLGCGFDTLKNEIKIQALDVKETATSGGVGDSDFLVEYDYKKIRNKMGVKAEVDVDTGITNVNISGDVSTELNVEEMAVYFFYRKRVSLGKLIITKQDLSARALALKGKTEQAIYSDLGNKVISSITKGGELIFIAKFTSRSVEESVKIKAKLDGKTEIFTSEVKFKAEMDSMHSEVGNHIRCSIKVKSFGGLVEDDQKFTNPATSAAAVTAWQATLVNLPMVTAFTCHDLNYVDASFLPVSTKINANQANGDKLNLMIEKTKDSKTMCLQYQKVRRGMKLPENAPIKTMIGTCETLLNDLTADRKKLYDNALAPFTIAANLESRVKTVRNTTPLFSYKDLERGADWGGFGNSGMPLFGIGTQDQRQLVNINFYQDSGLNGFKMTYEEFGEGAKRNDFCYATPGGPMGGINLQDDLIYKINYWGRFRDRWMAVGSLSVETFKGATAGPFTPTTIGVEYAWTGSKTVGAEKYIIGLWGRGDNWVQMVGPCFRQCYTELPYYDE
jgi:hypothetical protein